MSKIVANRADMSYQCTSTYSQRTPPIFIILAPLLDDLALIMYIQTLLGTETNVLFLNLQFFSRPQSPCPLSWLLEVAGNLIPRSESRIWRKNSPYYHLPSHHMLKPMISTFQDVFSNSFSSPVTFTKSLMTPMPI